MDTSPRSVLVTVAAAAALLIAACSDDSESADAVELSAEPEQHCETLDGGGCLLPFPSDAFTEPDDSTDTGLRVQLSPEAMPVNADSVAVDPDEWNRDDGFSPGGPILVNLPGLDIERSGIAPVTDIGASLDPDAPVVLLDAETGERVPYWAELDAAQVGTSEDPPTVADDQTALIIRPAHNLTHGHRHVVALTGLVDGEGEPLPTGEVFASYRDGQETGVESVEDRRDDMERVFEDLAEAGVERDDLQLAWDFTVRSTRDSTGRLTSMVADARDVLDGGTPEFQVDSEEEGPGGTRVLRGTFEAPSFLTGDGGPGSVLDNADDPDGIPRHDGERPADFICVVPDEAADVPGLVYGHGLLGSAEEAVSVGGIATSSLGVPVCAVDWIGMSSEDLGAITEMMGDFSDFRIIPDRLSQAHLEMILLGELMTMPEGFASSEDFADADGEPVLGDEVVFVGASQGGILGGATSAAGAPWDRAALVVAAQNYSILLDRSVNFDPFSEALAVAYPDALDRQVLVALAQQLWDRGENNGYSQHLTDDPLDGADPTTVLLLATFGDHQVANVATDTLARTAGIPLRSPGLGEGRSPDSEPFWGIDTVDEWPREGSVYVMWDLDTPAPPTGNVAPREGSDPHGAPAGDPAMLAAIIGFLLDEEMADPCPEDEPCTTP